MPTTKPMQIKARIKRIENKVKINFSPFCACDEYGKDSLSRCEIIIEDKGVQTIDKTIPDFCERCGKLIEKRQIIIQLIEGRGQS